jgi:hypothetical protein
MNEEQKKILQMVESGQITAEEGATLLGLVSESEPDDPDDVPQEQPPATAAAEDREDRWVPPQPYWLYPLSAGLIVMLVGGAVVAAAYQQGRASPWTLVCGWIPLFLGLAVVTIAAWARTARWIHMRIIDRNDNISLSFPLPLRFSALIIRMTRRFVPQFRDTGVDEAILALRDGLTDGQPIMIEVNNEEEGEYVRIHIG